MSKKMGVEMRNTISVEFLKLKRARALLLSVIAGITPPMIKFIQYTFGRSSADVSWEKFLSSGQEIMVLCMLMSVILVSGFVYSMEYQYDTASYIFTSVSSREKIYLSKMILLLAVFVLLFGVSLVSQLLFGVLTLRAIIPWPVFVKLLNVTAWYILSYFLVSAIVAMVAVLIKKFVVSAVVVFGYLMLVFPFHLKNNPYICPFMTPAVVAAKIFDSKDYYLMGYYESYKVDIAGMAIFLAVLAVASIAVGIACYKKMDAVR